MISGLKLRPHVAFSITCEERRQQLPPTPQHTARHPLIQPQDEADAVDKSSVQASLGYTPAYIQHLQFLYSQEFIFNTLNKSSLLKNTRGYTECQPSLS